MSDTVTIWDGTRGDWVLVGSVLKTGSDLATAVIISLFSDRVAHDDDRFDGDNPRGWWADGEADEEKIGSRLWLLNRRKQEKKTLDDALTYTKEALQWMITDQVVGAFDISCSWVKAGFLGITIIAHKPDGSTESLKFAWAWNS